MTTTLAALMAPYPQITLAQPEDNLPILQFLDSVSMNTNSLSLRYVRTPDYFAFTRQQGVQSSIFLFRNENGSIGGMGTIALRNQYVRGKLVRTGYHCELRTTPSLSRRARIQWRQLYRDLIRHRHTISDYGGCAYFYTAVLNGNQAAEVALTRKNKDFIYRRIGTYHAAALLGRAPGARWYPFAEGRFRRPNLLSAGLQVRPADTSDTEPLRKFLHRINEQLTLGDGFLPPGDSPDEWVRRQNSWSGFDARAFFIVEDRTGAIRGTVCPWLQAPERRLVLENMSTTQKLLNSALPLFGNRRIRNGSELNVLHLSHFAVDPELHTDLQTSVFELLLIACHNSPARKEAHLMTFRIPDQIPLNEVLWRNGFLYQTTGSTLYQILAPEDDQNETLLPDAEESPFQFELHIA
jgi:hypothetical protein